MCDRIHRRGEEGMSIATGLVINREKGWCKEKGWCAVRTLHNVHPTYSIQSVDPNPDGCACVTVSIVGARRGCLSQRFGYQ